MSNHSGSYMLNHVLELLDERGILKKMTSNEVLGFVRDITNLAWDYDCRNAEILENIGERLGICYQCLDYENNLDNGVCEDCLGYS